MDAPKTFISYSWTNPEHETWVLKLATELVDSGVDAIIDKWHLREGQDAIQFMESMVSDPEIKKVIIVSDKKYAEKSNNRTAGVGAEAQIISPEIYANAKQTKFVVVVPEKDEAGKAYLPVYYTSRIYIDLSAEDGYAQHFEQLLRWVFDKPVHVRPELGQRPAFLDDAPHTKLGTTPTHTRALDAIRNAKPYASGALDEFLSTFTKNFERFRMVKTEDQIDDVFMKSIGDFVPYRNQMIQLFVVIAQYAPTEVNLRRLHKFFENILAYAHELPEGLAQFTDCDWDNFKFIVHELFLYAIAILVDHGEYNSADYLLRTPYYQGNIRSFDRENVKDFDSFYNPVKSFEIRNSRLGLRRLDLMADTIKERTAGTDVGFDKLMQADFVLFIRSALNLDRHYSWFPRTLLYAARRPFPFEIFARSVSKTFFDRVKILLGIDGIEDLKPLFERLNAEAWRIPRWEYESFNINSLLGYDKLASKP